MSGGVSNLSVEISIPVPWGHISGKQWGDAKHSKVLAVHGMQDNCGVFDRLIPLLNGRYFIIAIDLPGHGLSSHFPAGFPIHLTDYVLALKRVVDHFGWDSFCYLGHSLGGQIGLFFAYIFPEFVKKLIVVDHLSPDYNIREDVDDVRKYVQAFVTMEQRIRNGKAPVYTYEQALNKMVTRESSLTKSAAEIVLKRSLKPVPIVAEDDPQRRKQANGFLFRMDQRIKLNPLPSLTFTVMRQLVSSIRCRSLIILATARLKMYKRLFPDLIRVYQSLENFTVVIVEGNHDVHQNNPERVVEFIDKFFMDDCKL